MSILKTNQIQTVAGKPLLHSTGGIIQVVSTYHGDRFTSSSTSWTDITNFNVSITPSSSSNKKLKEENQPKKEVSDGS